MTLIKLIDARRGLHDKCEELFRDKGIAQTIYQYLCDGIEDCDVFFGTDPVGIGWWVNVEHAPNGLLYATCSVCGKRQTIEATDYCGNCGARMNSKE